MEQEMIERLVRIETGVEGVKEHLVRLNGSVARHEGDIQSIRLQCAGERVLAASAEEAKKRLDKLTDDMTAMQATRSGALSTLRDVVMWVTVALFAWQTWSNHLQARAAASTPPPSAQTNSK
jgi:predicted  nucleic acid-binding Zn-ribbon protein